MNFFRLYFTWPWQYSLTLFEEELFIIWWH